MVEQLEGHVIGVSGDVPGGDSSRWERLAAATLAEETAPDGSLDVVFVDIDTMAELNETHMGASGPTDVLSFPLDDGSTDPGPGGRHLGDVVICPAVAEVNAPSHAGTVDAELTLLVVHGILHVLGHDHAEPTEADAMVAREAANLSREGFTHPGPQT